MPNIDFFIEVHLTYSVLSISGGQRTILYQLTLQEVMILIWFNGEKNQE